MDVRNLFIFFWGRRKGPSSKKEKSSCGLSAQGGGVLALNKIFFAFFQNISLNFYLLFGACCPPASCVGGVDYAASAGQWAWDFFITALTSSKKVEARKKR